MFRFPAYLGTLCFRQILSHIQNVRHIETYLPTFGYISANTGIIRMLAQLDIFMYFKAYSDPTAYSVSGTSFWYYSRAIYAYPEPYLDTFRHV